MNYVIIGLGNRFPPDQHQAITWTFVGLVSTWPSGTNFIEILFKNKKQISSFKKMHFKM